MSSCCFSFTDDNNFFKTNICLIADELLLNPNCVHYCQLHINVEVSISTLDQEY